VEKIFTAEFSTVFELEPVTALVVTGGAGSAAGQAETGREKHRDQEPGCLGTGEERVNFHK
jgi:hypothetical protein